MQHFYRVPRSFKLIAELNENEKEKNDIKSPFARHAPYCGVGLGDNLGLENYSTQMSEWQGSIIGPQNTNIGDRIYTVRVYCGPNYPESPPEVWVVSPKIAMDEVDNNGKVSFQALQRSIGSTASWNRTCSIIDTLYWVRERMVAAARNRQPPENSRY